MKFNSGLFAAMLTLSGRIQCVAKGANVLRSPAIAVRSVPPRTPRDVFLPVEARPCPRLLRHPSHPNAFFRPATESGWSFTSRRFWRDPAADTRPIRMFNRCLIAPPNLSCVAANGSGRVWLSRVIGSCPARSTRLHDQSGWRRRALELFHAFMLVHDDLIDGSFRRRGEPTLHEELRIALLSDHETSYSRKTARDLGLVAGDLLFALGMKLLGRAGLAPEILARSQRLLSDMLLDTGLGEALDVLYDNCLLEDLDESQLFDAYIRKTARYSVSGPMILGAILAGASSEMVRALRRFGDLLGLGYQIQNDLDGLDVPDHEECPDLDGGKRTWILWKTFQNLSETDREALNQALRSPSSSNHRAELQGLIAASGALGEGRLRLQAIRRDAVSGLRESPIQPNQRRAYLELITMIQPVNSLHPEEVALDGAVTNPI